MSLCILILNGLLFLTLFLKLFMNFSRSKLTEERGDSCPIHQEEINSDDDAASTISILPCSIIDSILGRLPLREMVRTSLLSREWRYKWATCPEIVFDVWSDHIIAKGHDLKPIIHNILRHHEGPLLKFAVQIPYLRSCPEIDEWLHLLPEDTLQDLSLRVSIGGEHRLTTRLFSFRHLRNLRLESCTFDPPLGFEGFNKLLNLELQNVGLVPDRFGEFMASCSAIETLRLFHCTTFDCLEITGPRLKLLEFDGIFSSISFKNCPLLRDVRLAFSLEFTLAKGFSLSLVQSLSCLPAVEELKLQANALEDLVRHGAPNKLDIALKSLRNIHLTHMYFEKIAETASAICFIRSCPILEKLRITAYTIAAVDSVASFLRSQETSERWTPQLRAIEMRLFCGNESEMEFLKYVLASATALEEIAITPHTGCITDGGESILNELKQYPRASPRAEFICTDGKFGKAKFF